MGCRIEASNLPGSVMAAKVQAIQDGITAGLHNRLEDFLILSDSLDAIHVTLSNNCYKGVEEKKYKKRDR